jgi:hypothetical protein
MGRSLFLVLLLWVLLLSGCSGGEPVPPDRPEP